MMKKEIISELEKITDEEQAILNGDSIKKQYYTNKNFFQIESQKLLKKNELITVRGHTRFIEFPQHNHDYIEIMYICKGTITHIIDEELLVMKEGDLIFLNQHIRHGIKKAGKEDIGINIIALPEFFDFPIKILGTNNILANFLVDSLRKTSTDSQYLFFRMKGNLLIENIMENIVYSLLNQNENEAQINQTSMGLLFMYVIDALDSLASYSKYNYREILLKMTLKYVNEQYKDATLTQLAKDSHQSLPALSRFIKRNLGFTFQELLQRKRFQQAVYLLVETELSVLDIISAVGYENSSYFYRKFRERYRLSPKEYRKQHKKDTLIYV